MRRMAQLIVVVALVRACYGNFGSPCAQGARERSTLVTLTRLRGRGPWRLRGGGGGEEEARGQAHDACKGVQLDYEQRLALGRFRRVLEREQTWIEANAVEGSDTRAALSAAPTDAQIRDLLERSNWVVETAVSAFLRGSDEHADERQREIHALSGQLSRFADTMGEEESAEHEAQARLTERQEAYARKRARAEEASFKRAVAMGEAKRQCREQFANAQALLHSNATIAKSLGGGGKGAAGVCAVEARGMGEEASELGDGWGGSAISGASMLTGVTTGLLGGDSALGMGDSMLGLGGSAAGNLTGMAEEARNQVDKMILGIDAADPFGLGDLPGTSVDGVTDGDGGKKEMLRKALLEEHRVYQAAAKRADLQDAAEEGRQRRERRANAERAKQLLQKRFGAGGEGMKSVEKGESVSFGIELPSSIQAALNHIKEPPAIQKLPAPDAEEAEKPVDVTIEMLADPSCPWCYVAQAMLRGAIRQVVAGREDTVAVRTQWQPYISSQQIPRTGMRVEEYVELMGLDKGWLDRVLDQGRQVVVQGGDDEPELFGKWRYWPYSVHAQRMLLDARERGGEPLVAAGLELLQGLTFQQGMNTGSLQVLCAVAAELGMRDPVAFLLSKRHYADLMRADQLEKHREGVNSVPLFRVRWTRDSETVLHTVSGPQGTDEWVLLLKKMLGDGRKEVDEETQDQEGLSKQALSAVHARGFGGKEADVTSGGESSETSRESPVLDSGGGGPGGGGAEEGAVGAEDGRRDPDGEGESIVSRVSRGGGDEMGVGVMAW